MAISMKTLLAATGCAVLVAGCATGPYYDNYGYDYGYGGYGPAYYGYPAYAGPAVGIGFGSTYYYDDDHRRYHGRGEWRDRDGRREWRDRDGPPMVTVPDTYRGPRNHAGEPVGPGYRGPPGSESP